MEALKNTAPGPAKDAVNSAVEDESKQAPDVAVGAVEGEVEDASKQASEAVADEATADGATAGAVEDESEVADGAAVPAVEDESEVADGATAGAVADDEDGASRRPRRKRLAKIPLICPPGFKIEWQTISNDGYEEIHCVPADAEITGGKKSKRKALTKKRVRRFSQKKGGRKQLKSRKNT
jgi:hypothetical protein